jgi:hypothetical protein
MPDDFFQHATLRARWLRRIAANPAAAISSIVIASAVISTSAPEDHTFDARTALWSTAWTVAVFWLAHVYAAVIAQRGTDRRALPTIVRSAMRDELATLEAPAPSIFFLVLGALHLIGAELAVNLALWAGVAQLAIWGAATARARGRSWPGTIGLAASDASFGLLIIALKSVVH